MLNIIIPVYNSSKVLEDALRSLENQTKKMFYVTVVDDCSEEDIKSVCEKFSRSLHIGYFRTPQNGGPGAARQLGLDKAYQLNFEYVMFLDADDILYPRAVEVLTREISRNYADFIMSPIYVEKKYDPGYLMNIGDCLTWLHGKIYRTSFLKKNNIRFTTLSKYNEDGPFNTLVANYTDNKFIIEEPVYLWRDYKNSITRRDFGDFLDTNIPNYLINMCEALQILIDNNSLKYPIENLCNLYKFYESLNFKQKTNNIYKALYSVVSNPIFSKELLKKESLKIVYENVHCGDFVDGKFKFYQDSFRDWFIKFSNQNGVEVMNENSNN